MEEAVGGGSRIACREYSPWREGLTVQEPPGRKCRLVLQRLAYVMFGLVVCVCGGELRVLELN